QEYPTPQFPTDAEPHPYDYPTPAYPDADQPFPYPVELPPVDVDDGPYAGDGGGPVAEAPELDGATAPLALAFLLGVFVLVRRQ
ncbi:MAG: hypothetical protein K0V04_33540, partial [Deltaproteobacteria bacterium]|nr:hypothetical protein [Deltaproteobacteria bacterium]